MVFWQAPQSIKKIHYFSSKKSWVNFTQLLCFFYLYILSQSYRVPFQEYHGIGD